jgi:hypothetical protein
VVVNAVLVKQGTAWMYRPYAKDRSLYRLEAQAKAAKRGLWALPKAERVPPWAWRRSGRAYQRGSQFAKRAALMVEWAHTPPIKSPAPSTTHPAH